MSEQNENPEKNPIKSKTKSTKEKKAKLTELMEALRNKLPEEGWPVNKIEQKFKETWDNYGSTKSTNTLTYLKSLCSLLMALSGNTRSVVIEKFQEEEWCTISDFKTDLSTDLYPCVSKIIDDYERKNSTQILANRRQDRRIQNNAHFSDNKISDWLQIRSAFRIIYSVPIINQEVPIINQLQNSLNLIKNNKNLFSHEEKNQIIEQLTKTINELTQKNEGSKNV
jgi:phenylpyruvate tautomerase PptA (4-oxalocrotonate tautomerase family)